MDSPVSREGAFLANNLIFAAFAFVVLLGTVFPLIVEAINGQRISVGAPYFETMTRPIGLVLLFLMAIAPVLPWRKASGELLSQRLLWPAVVGVAGLTLSIVLGARGFAPVLAFGLGGFAAGAAGRQIVLATKRQGWRGFVGRTNGGMIVHLGVILIGVAIAASSSFVHQQEVQLAEGATGTVAGHEFTYLGTETQQHPAKTVTKVNVRVDGDKVYAPATNLFTFSGQTIGSPSVRTTLREDVTLSVLDVPQQPGDPVLLRITVQPMVVWLWVGGGVIAFGTILAAFPGRRRRPTAPVSEPLDVRAHRDPDTDEELVPA
jgi:cytochrome c-type biogenesis protein CcmF